MQTTIPHEPTIDEIPTVGATWTAGLQGQGWRPYPDDKSVLPPAQRVTSWCLAWRVSDELLVLVHLRQGTTLAVYPSGLPTGAHYVTTSAHEPLRWGPCDATGRVVAA